ncbi:MAG: hypothetical protein HY559_06120 [Gammaproteobacteria bacterium]|nr:hypothetical protein [Gammaproteobacteria bacterium]
MKRMKELIILVVLLMGMGFTASQVQASWWNVFEGGFWTGHAPMYFSVPGEESEEEQH